MCVLRMRSILGESRDFTRVTAGLHPLAGDPGLDARPVGRLQEPNLPNARYIHSHVSP
jgi:hypothetical protein